MLPRLVFIISLVLLLAVCERINGKSENGMNGKSDNGINENCECRSSTNGNKECRDTRNCVVNGNVWNDGDPLQQLEDGVPLLAQPVSRDSIRYFLVAFTMEKPRAPRLFVTVSPCAGTTTLLLSKSRTPTLEAFDHVFVAPGIQVCTTTLAFHVHNFTYFHMHHFTHFHISISHFHSTSISHFHTFTFCISCY